MTWARNKPTKENRLRERPCPYCQRHMDKQLLQTLLDKSDAKKSSSMREALAKRKAAGEPIGRQREITKEKSQEILALRSHGLSYRQIAMQLKVSGSAVQRAIKRGIDG